ncbi:hypothetical protein, partial [Burkholderia cepacia]|uniref:hypothetical protein n=1 Tax=Burkholderia cepacia TaxID=292 RepID=UPI001E379871
VWLKHTSAAVPPAARCAPAGPDTGPAPSPPFHRSSRRHVAFPATIRAAIPISTDRFPNTDIFDSDQHINRLKM